MNRRSDFRFFWIPSIVFLARAIAAGAADAPPPARTLHFPKSSDPAPLTARGDTVGRPNLYTLVENLKSAYGPGAVVRIEKEGQVQPGPLAPGNGIHVFVENARGSGPSGANEPNRFHYWLMAPSYRPLGQPRDPDSPLMVRVIGRTADCWVYCAVEKGGLGSGGRIARPLGIDYSSFRIYLRSIAEALPAADQTRREAALHDLILTAVLNWSADLDREMERNPPFATAVDQALSDEENRRYIRGLLAPCDMKSAIAKLRAYPGQRGVGASNRLLLEAMRGRSELTAAFFQECLAQNVPIDRWGADQIEILRALKPPPPEILRRMLKRQPTPYRPAPRRNKLKFVALHQAVVSRCPGLGYEIAPLTCLRYKNWSREAFDYFRRCRDKTVAPGLLRAVAESWGRNTPEFLPPEFMLKTDISFGGEYAGFSRSVQNSGSIDWIELGSPWRGNLDLFCTLPFSEELKATLLDYLGGKIKPTAPPAGSGGIVSPGNSAADLLALNFLIRYPVPEALPGLLRKLDSGPDPHRFTVYYANMSSEKYFLDLVFNSENLTCVYAAQSIIRLGRDASPAVLKCLKDHLAENGPPPWPAAVVLPPTAVQGTPIASKVDLCLLILGFVGDEAVYDEFKELEATFKGTVSENAWKVANEWFQQGGLVFHLPREPLGPSAATLAAKPGPRIVRFPEGPPIGRVFMRDWGATGTVSWDSLGEPIGQVTIPSGKELKMEFAPGAPTVWKKVLPKVGIKAAATPQPPYLAPLRKLGPDDIQVVDLSGHTLPSGRLAALRGMRSLRELRLRGSTADDRALAQLKTLAGLELLDLSRTRVTDRGMRHPAALKSLRILDLGGTAVTDAAILHLGKLSSLRLLYIGETRITRAGYERLTKALPDCEIWK